MLYNVIYRMLEQVLQINTSNSQTCLTSGEQIVQNWNSQQQITNIALLMISLSSSYMCVLCGYGISGLGLRTFDLCGTVKNESLI